MQRRTILLFILLLTVALLHVSVSGRSASELGTRQRAQAELLEHLDERVLEPAGREQAGAGRALANDAE